MMFSQLYRYSIGKDFFSKRFHLKTTNLGAWKNREGKGCRIQEVIFQSNLKDVEMSITKCRQFYSWQKRINNMLLAVRLRPPARPISWSRGRQVDKTKGSACFWREYEALSSNFSSVQTMLEIYFIAKFWHTKSNKIIPKIQEKKLVAVSRLLRIWYSCSLVKALSDFSTMSVSQAF